MTISASNRRIVLLTAGIGSRLGSITERRNKCLLSINNQAVLSYILDSMPPDVPVVVGLGHFGDQVKAFLEITHPERRFLFKSIEPYAGSGSSSGYSLYSLRELVPGPFIFCTNDTIVRQQIRFEDRNWLGVGISEDIEKYTTVSVFGNKVTGVYRKGEIGGALAYAGLAEIHDAEAFWDALGAALEKKKECSDVEGLFALLKTDTVAKQVAWLDTGSKDRYDSAVRELGSAMHLPKEEEDLYFRNGRVIKFFTDAKKAQQRVERAKILGDLVPTIDRVKGGFYSYPWVEGTMLTEALTPELFRRFLDWADARLWRLSEKRTPPPDLDVEKLSIDFYRNKTCARLEQLEKSGYIADGDYVINGMPCKSAVSVLSKLGASFYESGVFSGFHGDLHPDNIIVLPEGRGFKLLDWRESFGGRLDVGDVYYDLAKFYHGLLVSHDFVRDNQFSINIRDKIIEIDIPVHFRNLECIEILERWMDERGLSIPRVRTVVGLIYLNIAALHHYPYNQFLYFFGLRLVNRALEKAPIAS
jgi:NDP-sugar pyrophosphorylase family protein